MNIEEAEKNLGKVVSFRPETKPYTNTSGGATLDRINNVTHGWIRSAFKDEGDCCVVITDDKYNKQEIYIKPEHLELKQDMKPLKIRLYNSKQFKPAFKKLIELGYHTDSKGPAFAQYIYTLKDGRICYDFFKATDEPFLVWSDDQNPDDLLKYFNEHEAQEVSFFELHDIFVLHRNNVCDATHKDSFTGSKWYICSLGKTYIWQKKKWNNISPNNTCLVGIAI